MCDYSKRLIAWMDGELAEREAAEVEQHVRACAACRECVSAYEAASRDFAAYHEATTQARPIIETRKVARWIPVAAALAAVAGMLVLAFMPRSTKQVPAVQQVAAIKSPVAPSASSETANPIVQPVAKRHATLRRKARNADWAMVEPAIQIAIPADAMFPPGALPEGVTYIANVSLGADGSVQGIQLATSN